MKLFKSLLYVVSVLLMTACSIGNDTDAKRQTVATNATRAISEAQDNAAKMIKEGATAIGLQVTDPTKRAELIADLTRATRADLRALEDSLRAIAAQAGHTIPQAKKASGDVIADAKAQVAGG